jgi:RNA polymerase sigma factor (sigma-70 family)
VGGSGSSLSPYLISSRDGENFVSRKRANWTITDYQRTNNEVTITTAEDHLVSVGERFPISAGDVQTALGGISPYTVTAVPTSKTLTFSLVGADIAPTSTSFINDYRKKTSKPVHFSFDTIYESGDSENEDDLNNVSDNNYLQTTDAYRGLIGDEVTKALESLQHDYRQIILLADIEEFSYEELSEILDIPIGTVRSRLFRARNLLKEKLKTYGKNLGYKEKR